MFLCFYVTSGCFMRGIIFLFLYSQKPVKNVPYCFRNHVIHFIHPDFVDFFVKVILGWSWMRLFS